MPLLPSCVLASSHLQQMIQIDVTEHRLREPWRVIEKLPPSILLSKLGHDLQMLYTKTTKDVAALRRNTLEQWHMLAQNIVRCFQGRAGRLFVLLACVPCYLTFSSHPHPLRVPLCLSPPLFSQAFSRCTRTLCLRLRRLSQSASTSWTLTKVRPAGFAFSLLHHHGKHSPEHNSKPAHTAQFCIMGFFLNSHTHHH